MMSPRTASDQLSLNVLELVQTLASIPVQERATLELSQACSSRQRMSKWKCFAGKAGKGTDHRRKLRTDA